VAPEIQDSIVTGPAALEAAIEGFPIQRPFLANNEGLFRELRPGIRALHNAAPDLAEAFAVGKGSLRRSVALNKELEPTFREIQAFAEDPLTALGLNGLRTATGILRPITADVAPLQTVCNYLSLWFRNVSSLLSEGDAQGTWQRFIIISAPLGPNNEGGPASAPASGPLPDNYLHSNPYPNTPAGGRENECESGNEPYAAGRVVAGNVPGNQGTNTERTRIVRDSEGSLPSTATPPDYAGGP
jgi:hypothetical protein